MYPGDCRSCRPMAITGRIPCRNGFTLLETLVTIGIIGLLVGLILPAIQAAREASRRLQCIANLKQIGIAIHAYQGVHGMFPPGQMLTGPYHTTNRTSGFVFILPHLEQMKLYSSFNMDFVHVDSEDSPVLENGTARNTRLSVYLCPSDGEPNHGSSYRFNRGRYGVGWRGRYDGPFSIGVLPTPAAIRDGLSRTAFASERIAGSFEAGMEDRARDIKEVPGTVEATTSDELFIPYCLATPAVAWTTTAGRYWAYNGFHQTDYSHNGRPNDRRPACDGIAIPGGFIGLHPPRSRHPDVVNVLFGDGHVEIAGDAIDQRVWASLGTHDGGD